MKVPCKRPQYALLMNKVFIFSVILLYLTNYFCKHETFLQYIFANMKQYHSFMISNFHVCYYQYYSSRRVSPPFIQCLYVVFGYNHFFTTINYFQRLYTTDGGYILLGTVMYYFRGLYITFDGYILLLALPDCNCVKI